MTQQHIIGEFSVLLASLEPAPAEVLSEALDYLRHEVEFGPWHLLPWLANDALALADAICLAALERGDVLGFNRRAAAAKALREFATDANLLP